jgi:uncharacterized protein with LGFP repeats
MMVTYSSLRLRAGLASVSNLRRALELTILGCFLCLSVPDAIASRGEPLHKTLVAMHYGKLPLRFEGNRGQTDDQVQFFTRGNRYTLFLTASEAVLVARPSSEATDSLAAQAVLRLQLVGANPTPQVTGVDKLPGVSHYFIRQHPQQWRTHVPTYSRVKYEAVYPGIDLVYYGNQGQLEYDFIVAPGADPQAITLHFAGTETLAIDAQGALVLHLPGGQVRMHMPVIYQEHDGLKQPVSGGYVLRDTQQIGFVIGPYDPTRPLVIDPVLVYATFLGGSNHDAGLGIAVDAEGEAYVTGMTASLNFPSATPVQAVLSGGYDAFVVKLSPDGSQLVYATYLGGSGDENMYEGLAYGDIAVDATGAAYVTGSTTSRDFPTVQALQPAHGGGPSDAFVAKLSPEGQLVYATYLGGSGMDMGRSIAVDATGAAYVTGQNESEDFPTMRPFQTTQGGFFKDGFVTKIDATGSQLVYSSYLGGNQGDLGFGIAVDTAGHAYVYGETGSPNFPTTPGAFDPTCGTDGACNGSGDLFITKVDATGETLLYSTYLGGSGEDRIAASHGMAVDTDGGVYVTGHTRSADFPTTYGQQLNGPSDAFVAQLNPQGTALGYAVFLGGAGDDHGLAIAVDLAHNAYITGGTGGTFPTTDEAYRCGDPGAFVTKLRADGSTAYALCLSGQGITKDRGHGIAVDPLGNAYVTGFTASSDFPTVNPVQPVHGGRNDAFVVKITDSLASAAIERKYRELGGPRGLLGVPVTDQLGVPDGVGQRRHFHNGSIYWHPDTGAWAVLNGPFWDKWSALGWEQGSLGYPVTDQLGALDGVGQRQRFQRGYIYWHPETGPQALLTGPIGKKWRALGWELGVLGYPVTDELVNPDGVGRRQHYQHGHIYWSPTTGAAALLTGPIGELWELFGWEQGVLGYPVTDELVTPDRVGRYLQFQYGAIYWSPGTGPAAVLHGPLWEKWSTIGREQGVLGYPVTNERVTSDGLGRLQLFQYGEIIWSPETGVHAVIREPFGEIWTNTGWEQGALGYPVTDEYHDPSCGPDGRRMDFENGYICWRSTEGVSVAYLTGDTTCPYGAEDCNQCVNNVILAFNRIVSKVSSSIAYTSHVGRALPPNGHEFPKMHCTLTVRDKHDDECDHVQGISRLPGVDGENWIVGTVAHADSARNANLEALNKRFGGFFLAQLAPIDGHSGEAFYHIDRGLRYSGSEVKYWYPVTNTDHPGGLQMLGQTMVVAADCARSPGCKGQHFAQNFVDFYNLTDPANAKHIHRFPLDGSQGEPGQFPSTSSEQGGVTAPAVVKMQNGRYLMFILGSGGHQGWLYVSNTPYINNNTQWLYIQDWTTAHVLPDDRHWLGSGGSRITSKPAIESVGFVTDCQTGFIYLLAFHSEGFRPNVPIVKERLGNNKARLYRLEVNSQNFVSGGISQSATEPSIRFQHIVSKGLDETFCTMRAGGSVHVSPNGDMVIYCSSYQIVPEGTSLVIDEWAPEEGVGVIVIP